MSPRLKKALIRFYLGLFSYTKKIPLSYLNEAVRQIYIKIIPRLLTTWLNVRVEVRNSALDPSQFNFLVSDLDLALVFEQSPQEDRYLQVMRKLKKLSSFLPMIKEVEICTALEFIRMNQLLALPDLRVLRHYRKAHWMKARYNKYEFSYSRAKHFRSWRRSIEFKLNGGGIEALAQKYISKPISNELINQCGTLSFWELNPVQLSDNKVASLLYLLDPLVILDSSSELAALKSKLLELEWLHSVSALRFTLQKWHPRSDWTDNLIHQISFMKKI